MANQEMTLTQSRFEFAKRNARFGYISTLATTILGFASRTIFIQSLGSAYLGVNALMTSVLGVLSFLELGIGAAMSYSLYKPVANNDVEKIRALARFYRTTYRVIALLVTIIGLALLPFIPRLAQGTEDLGDLRLYYALFLLANVLSYFAIYKTSIANAEQRNYIVTNIHTVISGITQIVQIVLLVVWANYLLFLVVMVLGRLVEQLYLNYYLNKRYSEYLKPPSVSLTAEELAPIKKNVKALIWHKIGEISVNQTDSIIIAAFVNVTTLGLISNYNLIINTATLFLSVAMNAAIGSFGNAIATSPAEDVYRNFKVYRFAAFWLYGLATVGMYTLITPLITLWIGGDNVISDLVILLILLNFYMLGHRTTINTVKSAAGIWAPDKYLPLIQAIVNLGLSIALVQVMGVAGVFLGTVAQGLIATIVRPIIVYPRVFKVPAREYFIDSTRFAAALLLAGGPAALLIPMWLQEVTLWSFLAALLAVFVWINLVFLACFGRSPEFRALRRRLLPPSRDVG